jgi:putative transposase
MGRGNQTSSHLGRSKRTLATGFAPLTLDQVKRLKQLEAENARLRKAVSDLTLEKVILKEAASGNF